MQFIVTFKAVKVPGLPDRIPQKFPSVSFEAEVYGTCKLECYSLKSYIRQVLDGGKGKQYKSIIGCTKGKHWRVSQALVDHVKEGKSSKILYKIRDELMIKFG